MEVSDDIVYNFFRDCSKKDVNPIELAKLLKEYRFKHAISQKQLAEQIGIPRNTLNNWEAFDRITEEEWKLLEQKGYSKTQITTAVRNNRVKNILTIDKPSNFDVFVQDITTKLRVYVRSRPDVTSQSSMLLHELKETVVLLRYRMFILLCCVSHGGGDF